jgi:hypothetical protein
MAVSMEFLDSPFFGSLHAFSMRDSHDYMPIAAFEEKFCRDSYSVAISIE